MRIFIDAGHGGVSIGASYKGRLEQNDTLRLAKAIKSRLEKIDEIEVMLSREGDTNPSITERCAMANVWDADYFISIHRNACSPEKANGVEAWVLSTVQRNGNTWNYAGEIVKALVKCGFYNRGVKKGAPAYADFGVNRQTHMHSCLVEVGFIDSTNDNKIFDEKFDEMADGIAEALCKIVEVPYVIKGDVNGDGKLTAEDSRLILRMATGLEKIKKSADFNGDGFVTAEDARGALKRAVGR